MVVVVVVLKGKGHPATGRGCRRGFGWVKAQDFLDVRHYDGGRSSAIRTSRLNAPGNIPGRG